MREVLLWIKSTFKHVVNKRSIVGTFNSLQRRSLKGFLLVKTPCVLLPFLGTFLQEKLSSALETLSETSIKIDAYTSRVAMLFMSLCNADM